MILWMLLALVLLDLCILEPRRWARAREAQQQRAQFYALVWEHSQYRAPLLIGIDYASGPDRTFYNRAVPSAARPVQPTDDPLLRALGNR